MRIGPFFSCPVVPAFFLITVVVKFANGSTDSHNHSLDYSTEKLTIDNELNEDDLIRFFNASTKSNETVAALFYDVGCQSSTRLVPLWKQAIYQLQHDQQSAFSRIRLPLFSTFLVQPSNKRVLEMIPVTHVPSIVFVSKTWVLENDDSPSLSILEFEGQKSSASEILNGLRHYLFRFQYSGFLGGLRPSLSLTSTLNPLTVQVDAVEEMELIVAKFQQLMFQRTNMPLDPVMTPSERDWVRYMFDENTDPDLLYVICQCQAVRVSTDEVSNAVHSAFDDVARVLSLRRDVVFCVERNCMEEGVIKSYQVVERNWTLALESSFNPNSVEESDLRTVISFFCQSILRPSLLWLDRQASAPIIFAPNNKLHAALLIDFHYLEHKETMRQSIVEFRRDCKARRAHNLVCYVVPSTDVRFLLQFGVDMWSLMDQNLQSEKNTSLQSLTPFPCVIVTDQRQDSGIDYRVLQHPFGRDAMGKFLDSIISHDRRSNSPASEHSIPIRKNTFGVNILEASNLLPFVSRTDGHSLVMFYAPSCGHCKRLKVIWNELGKLLEYCGLNHLKIGMYDVSTNELNWSGINVISIPEVYFFSVGFNPIKYDIDEAGGINDPIHILEWWLDVSRQNGIEAVSENELLDLLEGGGNP